MEVKPTEHKVQPLFYRLNSFYYREISFDGIKWYRFKVENIHPKQWTRKFDYIIEHTDAEQIKCDGFYDRVEKWVGFFDNQNIYNLYRTIINNQKLDRLKQSRLISDEEGKRRTMSIKELEEIKSNRVDLEDAPLFMTPTRIETEKRKDPKDKVDCLYVNFFWEEGGEELTLTNKYRPFHVKILLERMKALKIKNIKSYQGVWTYEKKPFGTLGFEKYLPALPKETEE